MTPQRFEELLKEALFDTAEQALDRLSKAEPSVAWNITEGKNGKVHFAADDSGDAYAATIEPKK